MVKFAFFLLTALFFPILTATTQTTEQNAYAQFINNGMEQIKEVDYKGALNSFEQARRNNDSAATAHFGLGIAYFYLSDDQHAERELKRALEINPREATVYQFLGELYYCKDELDSAASCWEKAVELDLSASGPRTRLERIRREHKTEKDFNRAVTSHFLVKYEGREKIEARRIVLRILEEAYGEVGRALSYYPDREIQVISTPATWL
ncbi:MAG TPA: tetratricopeptide repeat protein [Nitrospirota bacterium]|nr:tetratricopeptide repeat protein [Nitrospirota bacterium]